MIEIGVGFPVNTHSLSKQFARLTKPLRVSLGLAAVEQRHGTNPPFRRLNPNGIGVSGRLSAIENDLDRLIGGWNQHLPQILAGVAEARQDAREGALAHEEVAELRQKISELNQALADLSTRIDRHAREAPSSLAAAGNPKATGTNPPSPVARKRKAAGV